MRHVLAIVISLIFLTSAVFAEDEASVRISPEELWLYVEGTIQFEVEIEGDVTGDAIWEVGDEEVGVIDVNGLFTALEEGETVVTVTVGDFSSQASVRVIEEIEDEPGEPQEPSVTIFPEEVSVVIGDTVQFEVEITGTDTETAAEWAVDNTDIGTIDENGLFTAVAEGEAIVSVAVGDLFDEVQVTVAEKGQASGEGKAVSLQRQSSEGKITRYGSSITEGQTVTLGGIPHPFNYLNGGKLSFPEESLDDDIVITIKLPEKAHVSQKGKQKDVTFEGDIVSAVTFEVSVDGVPVHPYYFAEPIILTLPFKRGLLNQLGIDPQNLGMYYIDENGEFAQEGIADIVVDEENNTITGSIAHFSDIAVTPQMTPVQVAGSVAPVAVSLSQNSPNPFNPSTTITYSLTKQGHVQLSVYNITGQKITDLTNEVQAAGIHHATWTASDMPSGVYLYRIKAGKSTETKRMMLIK